MSKLGYWIVEPLVEEGEFYPKGGMRRLVCLGALSPAPPTTAYTVYRGKV